MERVEQATERTRSVEGSLEIDASPERVWEALTTAEDLERWFPLEARVEPGVGGSVWLSWKNEYAATSEIVEWEPARALAIRRSGLQGARAIRPGRRRAPGRRTGGSSR